MYKQIVMIGSAPGTRGGVAAVVSVYEAQGLFARWPLSYISTHRDGSKAVKLGQAARAWLAVMGRLLTGRIGLLHVHLSSGASFWRKSLFVLPAQLMGVPYVLHMHGGRFLDFYGARSPLSRCFVRYVFRQACRVIALSDEWRDKLTAMAPGISVLVVPNPVHVPPWQASLDGAPPTVLFLGILRRDKGVHELLQAWPAVRAAVPGARIVLGGIGDMDEVRALAASLGVADAVDLPGWIVGSAKDALMRRAWIFALPSHREALPMSILEAMAAGVPVVATRVGGIPMAVENGRTGALVEVQDVPGLTASLIALLTDRDTRLGLGRGARQRALDTFSADVTVPRIDALWREIAPHLERPVEGTVERPAP
jgi:glycosyltransferase involved in cell wall biosynthesis